ncbi:serine/threonine protein kinase [Azohydromonas aeria]|uniref:serine/threonine protein kinase n=1 Tax=Azohydromonas aeria TaxID=2590212 RepID=UPI0012F91845|nr:serine/threonine protein kinase [Azohydromonas aeria]
MTSYAALRPESVLDAVAAAGFDPDGRLLQLNSYENRVFQVFLEDGAVVVAKFYRPGRWSDAQILEEHAFSLALEAADVPVVAPLALQPRNQGEIELLGVPATLARIRLDGEPFRYSVSPRRAGRAPDLEDPMVLQWLGRFLGRLHAVGTEAPFEHRRTLDVATFGEAARMRLLEGDFIPPDQLPAWRSSCDAALAAVREAFDGVGAVRRLRLHGDCHPGNILWRDEGPHVVDLDDACTGPAVQDLWMLLSGDPATMAAQLGQILQGYRVFMPFDARELALVEPLRTLRMIHHSAWLAERWSDPAFPAAFPFFGTAAYWSEQTTQLREQLASMGEAPLELY